MKNSNEQRQYRYDAFISYRHNARDQEIAQMLLRLLESLRYGNNRRLHIFRDREEFPTSSDLGNDIHRALEESEFLILICSPEYLQSKWCREELIYFRQLHGNTNRNILPILVSGEPVDAFPQELFSEVIQITAPDGTLRTEVREIEPLGADVRAPQRKQALKALKTTEYLRIAAPILGCRFDDLYQREQRRLRIKLQRILAGIVTGALLMVSFLLWQLFQVRQAQLHEQLVYSRQLFGNADRLRAWQSSREILDAYFPLMDSQIRDGAEKVQFLTGYTPQFSVVTHISPSLSDHRMFFSSDGNTLLETDYTQVKRYSPKGELISRFLLGTKGQKICAVSPDGTRAAILKLEPDGTQALDLWDTEAERCIGTLLHCGLTEAVDGIQADFSPDGTVLSACRIGGFSNSNEKLSLFDSETGTALCELDGALAGTLADDGVSDRVVCAFSFLNSDIAHWTGSAYEVFYSISQDSVWQIPREWASRYAQAYPGCRLVLGRYAVVEHSAGMSLVDLGKFPGETQFEPLLNTYVWEGKPVQMLNDTTAAFLETEEVTQGGLFSRVKNKTVLSRLWICDLATPGYEFYADNLSEYKWENPVLYAAKDCPVVYLSASVGEKTAKMLLLRIDLLTGEAIPVPLNRFYRDILYLGSLNGQDFFAGDTGIRTEFFSLTGEGSIRSRTLDISLPQLGNRFDLSQTDSGVSLIGEYQGDFCLFSMESSAEKLDTWEQSGPASFAASPDGSCWIKYRNNSILASHNGALSGHDLDDSICYCGVGGNGNYFIGSQRQLAVYDSQDNLVYSLTQPAASNGIYDAIHSAKLSGNGEYLFWLTTPSVSGTGTARNTCRLHSLELSSLTITDYRSDVYWRGDLPPEDMYDCSADGRQIVFLSDTVIPELRVLDVNVPWDAKRAESSPFDALHLPTKEMLTGVRYAGDNRILCTSGSTIALVDSLSLVAVSGISELSAYHRLPELAPDGSLIYYGSNLNFWNVTTGELLYSIPADGTEVLTYSHDGKWFSITNGSGTTLYDASDRTPADLLSSTGLQIHSLSDTSAVFSDSHHIYRMNFTS